MEEKVQKINELMNLFSFNAEKGLKGNKSAAARARKTSLEIAKLLKEYRAESINESKK